MAWSLTSFAGGLAELALMCGRRADGREMADRRSTLSSFTRAMRCSGDSSFGEPGAPVWQRIAHRHGLSATFVTGASQVDKSSQCDKGRSLRARVMGIVFVMGRLALAAIWQQQGVA